LTHLAGVREGSNSTGIHATVDIPAVADRPATGVWRLGNAARPSRGAPAGRRAAARSAHWLLYFLMFFVSISGLDGGSTFRQPIEATLFGFFRAALSRCVTPSFRALIEETHAVCRMFFCTRRGALRRRAESPLRQKNNVSAAWGGAARKMPATRVRAFWIAAFFNQSSSSPRRSSRLIFQIVPVPGICTSGASAPLTNRDFESAPPGSRTARNPEDAAPSGPKRMVVGRLDAADLAGEGLVAFAHAFRGPPGRGAGRLSAVEGEAGELQFVRLWPVKLTSSTS